MTATITASPTTTAADYLSRGWQPIPLPPRGKGPVLPAWQHLRLTAADIPRRFGAASNIGVLLGEPSGWLVDVDLDHPLAVDLADEYLPATGAEFGREGKQRSHRLYYVTGPVETHQRKHPSAGMIVELRSTGHQTVFPGSIHPSGEPITWHNDGEPARIEPDDLRAAVDRLADEVERRLGLTGKTSAPRPRSDSPAVERAAKYVATIPGVAEGGRNAEAFRVAAILRNDFALPEPDAWAILTAWNETNIPPLSERELRSTLKSAEKNAKGEPGSKLVTKINPTKIEPRNTSAPPAPRPVLPYQPFPVAVLPEPLQSFVVEGAAAIGCDPSFVTLPALCSIARAIGTRRAIKPKATWREYPILWGAIIGPSGTHKTPAMKLSVSALETVQERAFQDWTEQRKNYDEDLQEWERDAANWKKSKSTDPPPEKPSEPICERYIVGDATIEALADRLHDQPDGLLVVRDELAGWLDGLAEYKGGKGSDTGHWLALWSAQPLTVDRKMGTRKTIHVSRAAVSLIGGIQPGVLKRALGREHLQDGLCARLLMVMPPPRPVRWSDRELSFLASAAMTTLIDALLAMKGGSDANGRPEPVDLRFTPEAREEWIAYYNRHRAEMADLDDDLAAAWTKLEAYTLRLALIVHCIGVYGNAAKLEENEGCVDVDALRAAITLTDWFGNEAKRVYGTFAESDEDRQQRKLIEAIERRGGKVTPRELQQGCRWIDTADEAETVLQSLVSAGVGHWEQSPPGEHGGRAVRRFTLSTASTVYTTPAKPEKNRGSVDVDTVDTSENEAADANAMLAELAIEGGAEWES